MSDEAENRVASNENVARYILKRNNLRSNLSVRPDAFIPHPYRYLSVTRHLGLSESELWDRGRDVAQQTGKNLYARADVQVLVFEQQKLRVISCPTPSNSNHANVVDWPLEKSVQKIIAQEIAAAAKVLKTPNEHKTIF